MPSFLCCDTGLQFVLLGFPLRLDLILAGRGELSSVRLAVQATSLTLHSAGDVRQDYVSP